MLGPRTHVGEGGGGDGWAIKAKNLKGVCLCVCMRARVCAHTLGHALGLFILKLQFSQIWLGTKSNRHFCSNAACVVFDLVSGKHSLRWRYVAEGFFF